MPRRDDNHPLDYYNQVWDYIQKLGSGHPENCDCDQCDLRKEFEIVFDEYDSKLRPDENGKLKAPIGVRLDIHIWRAETRFNKKHTIDADTVIKNSIGEFKPKYMTIS